MTRQAADVIGDGQPPRLCQVTLLFSDLCGYTALTESSDPEDVDALRGQIVRAAEGIVEKHGGTVSQIYGDGLLVIFGLPVTQEEDGRHALEAALELHRTVRGLADQQRWLPPDFELRLHSGIESGLVLASLGNARAGQYQLTGDAVNTAARLCALAEPDVVLASAATLHGLEGLFELQEVPPLTIAGKRKSVMAYRVLGQSNARTRFEARARRGLTPLVGRTVELERLKTAMSGVVQGQRRVLGVLGAPGIGKTRLLEEFMRWAASADGVICRATCESHGNVAPLHPFLQVLRQIFELRPEMQVDEAVAAVDRTLRALQTSLQNWSAHRATYLHLLSLQAWPPGEAPSSDDAQRIIITALCDLFVSLAQQQPLLLIIDDWQWADDGSRQVLGTLLRVFKDQPALFLIGARTLDAHEALLESAEIIELLPFTDEQSRQAIRALVPSALDLGLGTTLHRRSGGNPLFLEELCQTLPRGHSGTGAGLAESGIPNTIHGLMQARIERLPARQADVLRAASVIGNEIPFWLIERVSGLGDELLPALSQLLQGEYLYQTDGEGTFRFKHEITRDGVYRLIRRDELRRLHGLVARSVEERFAGAARAEYLEALAYHYAGSHAPARAVEYAELAGDKAAATSSLDRARLQYRAALTELDKLGEDKSAQGGSDAWAARWLSIAMKWAAGCVFNPEREQIQVLLRASALAERLGDPNAQALVHYWLGWIYYTLGEQALALTHTERARQFATRAGNDRLQAQLALNLGQSHAAAGEYATALSFLHAGIQSKRLAAARITRPTVPVGFVYALGCEALVHAGQGDFAAGERCLHEALAAIEGTGHAVEGSLLVTRALTLLAQTRWSEAIDSAARARATAERVNGPYVFALSEMVTGHASFMQSRAADALPRTRRAVDWLESRGVHLYLSWNYANLAESLALAGEHQEARRCAERTLARADQQDAIGEASAWRTLARLGLAEGTSGSFAPQVCLEHAAAAAERQDSPRERGLNLVLEADLAAAAGARPQAQALRARARGELARMGMAGALADLDARLHQD